MADTEKQLTLNVTTKHQAAVKGLVAVGGSLTSIGSQAKKAQAELQGITAYKDLVKQTGQAKAAWKAAETQVKELAASIKATNDPTKQQVSEFNKAVTAAGKLKEKYTSNSTALAGMRQKLAAVGVDTSDLTKEQNRLATAFSAAKKQAIAATKIDLARGLLDVDNPRKVQQEIAKLKADYARLEAAEKTGSITSKELAQAKQNLKTKLNELSGATTSYTKTSKLSLAQLGAMAGGFYGVVNGVKALINATSAGETSTYLLEAAIDAANRQFDVGSMDDWSNRLQQLSSELRIYSQTELESATAKTIEMTKRLGLTADQMERVITVSADLSAGKTDLAGGIERVTAALRGEAESSEYLGLTLNENYVKAWYEANTAHEKAWAKLTDLEKAQIRYQVLLEQATGTEGRAANSITTLAGAWQYMLAQINNAIRNNEDLQKALEEVTTVISKNAGSIVSLMSTMISAIGKTAEWIVQHKELAAGIAGVVVSLKLFGGSLGSILGMINSIKAAGVPEILGGAGGSINSALVARIGLYGTLAATVWKTYEAYKSMREAQDEAEASARRLAATEAYAQGIVNYANETTGLQIKNIGELNNMLRAGTVVVDELTGEYLTLAQAQELQAERTEEQVKRDEERQASFERLIEYNKQMSEAYGDLDMATLTNIDRQKELDAAIADTAPTVSNLQKEIKKTADAYYDAVKALRAMTEGEEGYEKAQKKMLSARKAYVNQVKALNDQLWSDAQQTYSEEEQVLRNSLERRKLQLDKQLSQELISREQYIYQAEAAETALAEKILKIRQDAADKSAEIYGQDSEQYKAAALAKIEAELSLEREKLEKLEALNDMAATKAKEKQQAATSEATSANGSGSTSSTSSTSTANKDAASGFYGNWDALTNSINGMTSMDELRSWYQDNRKNLQQQSLSMSAFTRSLAKHAQDLYRARISELKKEASSSNSDSSSSSTSTSTSTTKTMTINLKTATGATVSGTFAESDASKLISLLQQAGLTTA